MSIYDEMQKVASGVLGQFDQGGLFYIQMTPHAGATPDDPGEPTATPYKMDGAARGVKFRYIDGTEIVASDLQATFAVRPDVTPDMTGFIALGTANGPRYKIVRVDVIPPTGMPVAHRVFFRK